MPPKFTKTLTLIIFQYFSATAIARDPPPFVALSIDYINSDYYLTINQKKSSESIAFNEFSHECCSVEKKGNLAIIEGEGHTEFGASYQKFSIQIKDNAHLITSYQSCATSFLPRPEKLKTLSTDCIAWDLISGKYKITIKSKKTKKQIFGKKILIKYLQLNKNALREIALESPLLELY